MRIIDRDPWNVVAVCPLTDGSRSPPFRDSISDKGDTDSTIREQSLGTVRPLQILQPLGEDVHILRCTQSHTAPGPHHLLTVTTENGGIKEGRVRFLPRGCSLLLWREREERGAEGAVDKMEGTNRSHKPRAGKLVGFLFHSSLASPLAETAAHTAEPQPISGCHKGNLLTFLRRFIWTVHFHCVELATGTPNTRGYLDLFRRTARGGGNRPSSPRADRGTGKEIGSNGNGIVSVSTLSLGGETTGIPILDCVNNWVNKPHSHPLADLLPFFAGPSLLHTSFPPPSHNRTSV
ncbi:hypothetical protein SKAU_G00162000 [Synaphobranchus kaupii]|uniref:Uncharacterized protein n=1 Tax=Synaphobranchus kaupii TaxID=118154 RepID=A0A9Q1FJA5_SYNKA|nr:hypothetical protein SKAU_G00162000 [Synaphobranchus kaupii]